MRHIAFALLLLAGCQSTVPTTSGAAYRAARPDFNPQDGSAIDQAVGRAAQVGPLLRFPARIDPARIRNGQLAAVPPREADAWIAFAQSHADLGSFEPISPLVAELTASAAGNAARTVVDRIRRGAARQHVDAVLIYTAASQAKDQVSPLSLLDLTIIGVTLVPSRSVQGSAVATALLIDVRNGYPYGTANAVAQQDGFVPAVGSGGQSRDLADDAEVAAVGKLTAAVDTIVGKLRIELEEKELASLRAERVAARPALKRRGCQTSWMRSISPGVGKGPECDQPWAERTALVAKRDGRS